jgi:hypothetical protein
MKIRQISVFLENRPGRLAALCRTIADAGVNLSTLMLSETGEFGLMRFLTPEPEKAKTVIAKAGYAVTESEVLAIQVPDKPGGLSGILNALEPQGVSVEYMYAFVCRQGRAIMIIRFDNLDRAIEALKKANINIFKACDILPTA